MIRHRQIRRHIIIDIMKIPKTHQPLRYRQGIIITTVRQPTVIPLIRRSIIDIIITIIRPMRLHLRRFITDRTIRRTTRLQAPSRSAHRVCLGRHLDQAQVLHMPAAGWIMLRATKSTWQM
jgi:hypothetical protein